MKSTLITVLLFIILIIVIVVVVHPQSSSLISPSLSAKNSQADAVTPTPTAVPPVEPQTYQYDRSTDLKAEFNKVNPQVLDSDFQ